MVHIAKNLNRIFMPLPPIQNSAKNGLRKRPAETKSAAVFLSLNQHNYLSRKHNRGPFLMERAPVQKS